MESTGTPSAMKLRNQNLVRRALREKREATKQALSEITRISSVTVGAVLSELVSRGEAIPIGFVPSSGGRPAKNFHYNGDFRQALVIYLHFKDGRDVASYRVINLFGDTVDGEDVVLNQVALESFEAPIREYREVYPAIGALGFGLPGFEFQNEMIVSDYEMLRGAAFSDHYRKKSGLPVAIENDVNLAVIGCCRRHPEAAAGALLYLYFPVKYPPGVGLCFNGRIHRGMGGFAGEVGFLPIDIDWQKLDYGDFDVTCEAVSRLLLIYIAIINPERAVISGSFITAAHLQEIKKRCAGVVGEGLVPELLCSHDFDLDHETGLRWLALDALPDEC